jgi:thiol-disulfide isomerase/thioredoxin
VRSLRIASVLIGLTVAGPLPAQSSAELRSFFFRRDFEGGYRAGLTSSASARDSSPEWRAWLVVNEARYGLVDEALSAADSLPRGSRWRDFARVMALCQTSHADAAVPIARSLAASRPAQLDFVWAYTYALLIRGRYGEVPRVVDSLADQGVASAELRALEGRALSLSAMSPLSDSSEKPRALVAFDQARRLDSTNVDADYYQGELPTLDRAAARSPFAPSVHEDYWHALLRTHKQIDDSTRTTIARDIANILDARSEYPGALYLASEGYELLDSLSRQRALEDRIVSAFASSPEVDRVFYDRFRAASASMRGLRGADSLRAILAQRARLAEFVAWPVHHDPEMLGFAYVSLFMYGRSDTTVDTLELLRTVRGMVRYDELNPEWTRVGAPILLADRRIALRYAEQLAGQADSALRRRDDLTFTAFPPQERAQELSEALGRARDALGWVYFNEGRVKAAARTLSEGRALDPTNALVYYHLGRLAEALGDRDSAQARYAKGYQIELTRPAGTQNRDALRRLYAARHGSNDGFDAYVDTLRARDRRERRTAILASRARHPKALQAFALDRLVAATRVTSDSLRGKVVVVHFWGTWCGWCVAELPDFERWYETIRADTGVVVLSIDYADDNRDAVRRFAEQHHLAFPILMDEGYVDKTRVRAFPTTWFVDRDGRIAFVRAGWSGALAEEFGWRLDALRE